MKRLFQVVALLVFAVAAFIVGNYLRRIAGAIERQSTVDEARPADTIVVLGAAEYRGKPSPILEARLNHALWLYLRHMAPLIITTGGAGGAPIFPEGAVGRSYLTSRGVRPEDIVVESQGDTTVRSTAAVVEIMRRMNLKSCIVVSDGYHIYRVKKILEHSGLDVYGSPRPSPEPGGWRAHWLYLRQAVGYGLWRVGIPV